MAESAPLSAVIVAENMDLLTSILTRVEAKPLIRFKSVSKQWLSLISSSRFSLLHLSENPNPKPSAVFFNPDRETREIDYEFVPLGDPCSPPFRSIRFGADPSSINVLSSCNGLLLCGTSWNSLIEYEDEKLYVFNPTTKQFSDLTSPIGGFFSSPTTQYSLAFDPMRSPHYKVLMVRRALTFSTPRPKGSKLIETKQMFEIQIYSSETRSWKKHDREIEWPKPFMFERGVYWNGAMHWASKSDGIICFDIDQKCTRPMPEYPPFHVPDDLVMRHFGESGVDLLLVDVQGYEVMEMDVYVLERDYSRWSQKYRVDMNQFSGSYPTMISPDQDPIESEYFNFSILGVVQAGNEELVLLHVPGKVISYNFKSKSIKELRDLLVETVYHRPLYFLRSFEGYVYSQTLATA